MALSVRQELESRLAAFAAAQSPPLAVAWEGISFTRPTGSPWLECFLISSNTISATVDATRNRERGSLSINVWYPSGVGVGKADSLAASLVKTFPVIPKQGSVSIEQPGNTSKVMYDIAGWICINVNLPYRVESSTV